MNDASIPTDVLIEHAAEISGLLKLMANEHRLLLLCRLSEGDAAVGELVEQSGMAQSSVSQHLAKLREGGVVKTRRVATTIYYSIADPRVHALMAFLCDRLGPQSNSENKMA